MFEAHPAKSDADRQTVMDIAYAAFESQDDPLVYAARRMASPLRRRATWWLARVDGTPVASLLAHSLVLGHGDQRIPAYGLGSVAVHPGHQRTGLGSRLCAAVDAHLQRPGLLFSAVPPRVYQGLGFQSAPAFAYRCDDLPAFVASGPAVPLTPIDPVRHRDTLAAIWDTSTDGWTLARDPARWAHTLHDNPDHLWFWVEGGYVRLVSYDDAPDELEVVELFAADPPAALRACAALAVAWGRQALTTWLDLPDPAHPFVDVGRAKTLPMLKGVGPQPAAWFSSADYF